MGFSDMDMDTNIVKRGIEIKKILEKIEAIIGHPSSNLLTDEEKKYYLSLATRTLLRDFNFAVEIKEKPLLSRVRMRILPLFITLILELIVAAIFASFSNVISKYPALISFVPLISAISGNNGLISATIAIRGFAVGTEQRGWEILWRECLASFLTGLTCGCIASIIAYILYHSALMSITVFLATTLSLTFSGTNGVLAPIIFSNLGIDPARVAGPAETASQDLVTYTIYLSLLSFLPKLFSFLP